MPRRQVIPDIHGCIKTFKALIEKIALTKEDTLYLLGDYIDRGASSSSVLDYIMELIADGYNVKPLRGNHEHEFLLAYEEYDPATFKFYAKRFKSADLITKKNKIIERFFNFMNSLPFYIELPDFYLVHGGIDFRKVNPYDDPYHLLTLRKTYYDEKKAQKRKVIVGHQPTNFEDIQSAVENRSNRIPLDNGCIYTKPHRIYDYTKMGNLLCFNMDSWELTMVKNIDE